MVFFICVNYTSFVWAAIRKQNDSIPESNHNVRLFYCILSNLQPCLVCMSFIIRVFFVGVKAGSLRVNLAPIVVCFVLVKSDSAS